MNDLQMIRELDDTPLPSAADLGAARASLVAAITADSRRRPPRRAIWAVAATGVAAATAIIVMATAPHPGGTPEVAASAAVPTLAAAPPRSATPSTAATPTNPSATAPTTKAAQVAPSSGPSRHPAAPRPAAQPPALRMAPAVFLARAAAAAKAAPDVAPRPDQFLYVKDGDYEAWLSMDGTHDGLIDNGEKMDQPGCRNGMQQLGNTPPAPCTVQPAYLSDAPTTPTAMVAYIGSLAGSTRPNSLGKELMGLAEFNYLRPAAKAALFEAAPLLPGLHLTGSGVLNLGAPAVAINWNFGSSTTTLLFNPTSYALVGCTTAGEQGEKAGSAIRQAVVDRVGQRP
jgi:hypothetical protein